ncbi:MAG: phosphoenolpyruvate--protein phosphotransferase [Treponema sp.]|nr:phosphoenolpyruvate--protein phosphotransferase [Treponema sp.]
MKTIQGTPVSNGYAVGQLYVYKTLSLECERVAISAERVAEEKRTLARALEKAKESVKNLIAHNVGSGSKDAYAIFEGYLEIINDEELQNDIATYIEDKLVNFDTAVGDVAKQYVEDMLAIDDAYLQARAEDFKQIFRLIKMAAHGDEGIVARTSKFILAAKEIGPADMEAIDKSLLLGILVESGSKTSHAAILSRALGIPMVSGIEHIETMLANNAECAIDGEAGVVYYEPTAELVASYHKKIATLAEEAAADKAYIDKPARTKDGTAVAIYANIGSEEDVDEVLENKADGIGLFRTEFLFMKNGGISLPSEEAQFKAYKYVLEKMEGKPVIFRTLDAGGDKNIEALHIPPEANPFLGLRAIRFCLQHTDVFRTQLRALLRAAVYGNARIMLPMIIMSEEIAKTKSLIADIVADCKASNIPVAENVPLGIMIETPAAAVMAEQLAKEAAFFNIGTNDLTQYTLAVDRGNETIAPLYNEAHPAVLALIENVVRAGNNAGISVDVCGEMAGNIAFTEQLLKCGVRGLSMSAINMPKIKHTIAELSL